ncbi:azurin [Pseudomonas sp. TWI672]|uniref:azurin n=1 Tax=unclassified Pseudomonas TaxID=196821 RepID=UPI00320A5054
MRKFLFIGMFLSSSVFASDCEVTISSNDQMKFDQQVISIPKGCSTLQVTLHHAGKLPKLVMGHNLVIVKKSDLDAVANDAMAAGAGNDYLKADDPRVLAHTPLIGGGEEGKAILDVKKLETNEQYVFFCSFPGHRAIMQGEVVLM